MAQSESSSSQSSLCFFCGVENGVDVLEPTSSAFDAFVLSHAILLEIARDTLQFQELLSTDRIARLFDMFPVGKLSELSTTSERVWIHCALASFNNSVIVCEALTESRMLGQSTSTLMQCLYLQSFLFT